MGHDWGGMVAWPFAMTHPEKTDRLVILNLPHPNGPVRELANNPEQQKNSQYARRFQNRKRLHICRPKRWCVGKGDAARPSYFEAFSGRRLREC